MIPFSDEELYSAVENVIEKIRPSLALDGGDIVFPGVKPRIGCVGSGNRLKYGVERQMRIDIHPEIEVIDIPVDMENRWDRTG